MARAIFRLRLPDGTIRLASGTTDGGPTGLLASGVTVESLLLAGVPAVAGAARTATDTAIPEDSILLAPIDTQEVWGAGVTYERSRVARTTARSCTRPSRRRPSAAPGTARRRFAR